MEHLHDLPFAPSVALQDVPSESLSKHLGFDVYKEPRREDDDNVSDLDEKIMRMFRISRISTYSEL